MLSFTSKYSFARVAPFTGTVARAIARQSYSSRAVHIFPGLAVSAQTSRTRSNLPAPSLVNKRWATSTTPHSTASDPAEVEALQCLEQGNQKLEEGDVEAAKALYQRSVEIKPTASSLFNLGVTHYHSKQFDESIRVWKESIAIQPSSADAHTNLASAYLMLSAPRPDLALHHLNIAASLAPEDGEIAFNMAVVLESMGKLEEALEQYRKSKQHGIGRADMHIRNVSAKILGRMAKQQEQERS